MSSFEEYMAEQDEITERYDDLDEMGTLAHELGAEIETCENFDSAIKFCADRQDEMYTDQQVVFTRRVSEDREYYEDEYGFKLQPVRGLTKIGDLAQELGADIDICVDLDKAHEFCAARSDAMDPRQLRVYDEAVADRNEDATARPGM